MDMYDASEVHPVQYHFDSRFKERLALPDPSVCSTAQKHEHRNRTTENYPTDEGLLPSPEGEFINASIIDTKDRQYIATQHPLPSTTGDFWKMVLAEKPCAIIMLNKVCTILGGALLTVAQYDFDQAQEGNSNQPELVQYWPGDNPKGFIETLIMEDKVTGGMVKVTIVDDVHHKIEELVGDGEAQNPVESVSTPPNLSPATTPSVTSPVMTPTSTSAATSTSSTPPIISLEPIASSSSSAEPTTMPLVLSQEDVSPPPSPPLSPCDRCGTKRTPHNKKAIECSKLRVEYQGQVHEVWHIRCATWKDQDAPDLDMFMDLWRLVEERVCLCCAVPILNNTPIA